mmetsp:Transcript_17990/g.44942  ORF Transcript_17990/g.44942 Transcript_17990/m.44942 type:complete len:814 (+) Transcript_17990:119-2560(+)|eukprot:CAMPEP_0178986390 /NCGR_PEP_ID=MMETSP0795-20121207/2678_1 /TAXON_ID=88552 /ORGANISM="Amoebophrya sp., Strain Ameob2" /LENGTH=813 /DNA_ID=CAMNT_0020677447 /DNA_START=63 /DNA_END=2504 /DNA_ORIENTATION=+
MKKLLLPTIFLLSILTAIAQPPTDGFYLDGVDDFIELSDSDNINTTIVTNRTIEGYFKVDDATSRQVIYKEGGGSRGIVLYVENDYVVVGAYNRSSGDYTPRWNGTYFREPISDDTWYHIALVFDNVAVPVNDPIAASDNTSFKWYLDGTLMDSRAGFEVRGHSGDINLGRSDSNVRYPNCGTWTSGGSSEYCFNSNSQSSSNNYFAGNIWGFRIWDDVRTATEIDDNKDILITTVGTDNLVAALDGDTVTYLDDDDAVVNDSSSNKTIITWSATASTTSWTTGSNWVGGNAPDATKLESVVIPSSTNYPVLTAHTEIGELTVNATASITVNAGATLDVYYDLENNGTITLENDAALLARENIPVSGTGDFVVKRDSPNYSNTLFYSYWSTPIDESSSTIATLFPEVGGFDYYWNASATNAAWNNNHTDMEVGRGYALRANHLNVETATFTGTVNNGDITEPVYYTVDPGTSESGYNIIGNPYPSAISWEAFQSDNSDEIEGTVYYWRQTEAPIGDNLASDYIEYNNTGSNPLGAADGNITTAQGFAVQAKSGTSGTVTFKNSHRIIANNAQFFRSTTETAYAYAENTPENSQTDGRISLRLSGGGFYATQLLGFLPEGTEGYDDSYDGHFINEGNAIEFYSHIGATTEKLSIQALPELATTNIEVSLGYEVRTNTAYTIAIDAEFLDSSFDIILEDRTLNTFTDLRQVAYTFQGVSGEDNNRFYLHLDQRTLNTEDFQLNDTNIYAYFSDDVLTVKTTQTNLETVTVYNMTGQKLFSADFDTEITAKGLAKGIYIVQFRNASGAKITKKIVK